MKKMKRLPHAQRTDAEVITDKKKFLSALRKEQGWVIHACIASGIPRRSVYEWKHKDDIFSEYWNEIVTEFSEFRKEAAVRGVIELPRKYDGVTDPETGEPVEVDIPKGRLTHAIFLSKALGGLRDHGTESEQKQQINVILGDLEKPE